MPIEALIAVLLFFFALLLLFFRFETGFAVLLVLSVLLHKEFFSVYRWDLLPIRIFMLAFLVYGLVQVFLTWRKERSIRSLIFYIKDPFVFLLLLVWLVNGISILFSRNLIESILLFGFLTTVVSLGILFYLRYKNSPEKVFLFIKKYIYVMFGTSLFGFLQIFIHMKYNLIIGSLWVVPGHFPRVGSTFWDVNHYAALLASILPVLGVLILVSEKVKDKLISSFMFIPITVILVLTSSRSAWILAAAAFLVFVIISVVRILGKRGLYLVFATLVLFFTLFVVKYMDKESAFRAGIKNYINYRVDSYDSHLLLLQGSAEVFENYPLFGGGYGGFFEQFSKTKVSSEYFSKDPASLSLGSRTPGHSIWGESLAETGIVGFSALSLFMLLVISTLIYAAFKHEDKRERLISAAMAGSMIGWVLAGVFYSYKAEFFWIVFFLYFTYAAALLKDGFDLEKIVAFFTRSRNLLLVVLILISSVLIFWNLGKNHLIPWDEAIYAKVAKNMAKSGEYIVQRWDPKKVWYEKPPLYMWSAAVFMNLIGVSEWAVRLPSAILGLLTVLLVYKFGKEMFGKVVGFISAFTLLTTFHFLYYTRASMLDVALTFFITLSLYFYWRTFLDRGNVRFWVLAGLSMGAAVMVKNVVGLLPLAVVSVNEYAYIFSKEKTISKSLVKNVCLMLLGSAVIVFPWHLEMLRRFGMDFVNNYLIYHVFTRGIMNVEEKGKPLLWYITVMKVSMRVWFIAFLGALPYSLYLKFVKGQREHRFLIIWAVLFFIFFSISRSKLIWYIIPVYPAVSIMVGYFINKVILLVQTFVPRLKTLTFRFLAIYFLVVFGLMYMFLNKNLVYTDDLTYDVAVLLEKKDELYPKEKLYYVDNIDFPIIAYYTDGRFEKIENEALEKKLERSGYDQRIVFLIKNSKFKNLSVKYPFLISQEKTDGFILGVAESKYTRDKTRLEGVEKRIEELEKYKALGSTDILEELSKLKLEEANIKARIEEGLKSVDS